MTNEELKINEVKGNSNSNKKYISDDMGYFLELLIKQSISLLLVIGLICLLAYVTVVGINNLNEYEVKSKTNIAETYDNAAEGESKTKSDYSHTGFWIWYYSLFEL